MLRPAPTMTRTKWLLLGWLRNGSQARLKLNRSSLRGLYNPDYPAMRRTDVKMMKIGCSRRSLVRKRINRVATDTRAGSRKPKTIIGIMILTADLEVATTKILIVHPSKCQLISCLSSLPLGRRPPVRPGPSPLATRTSLITIITIRRTLWQQQGQRRTAPRT